MKFLILPVLFIFLALAVPGTAVPQFIGGQDFLGVAEVKEKSKRGSIRLGRGGAGYSGVVIEVPGGAEVVKRLTVQFADRTSESFSESRLKLHNGRSDALWFRSRDQVIERISLLYIPDAGKHSGTEVRVYGIR
ncbi:MAG: hypothetical protein R3348_01175 [Xanthomonadales bacterium]|nr:hypothetical protein [Xanthomonadales bacterium]